MSDRITEYPAGNTFGAGRGTEKRAKAIEQAYSGSQASDEMAKRAFPPRKDDKAAEQQQQQGAQGSGAR